MFENNYLLNALVGGGTNIQGAYGVPQAAMTPEQIKQMSEQGANLSDATMDPTKGQTGAGAIGHVLNAIRGALMQRQAFQGGAGQLSMQNRTSKELAPTKYSSPYDTAPTSSATSQPMPRVAGTAVDSSGYKPTYGDPNSIASIFGTNFGG